MIEARTGLRGERGRPDEDLITAAKNGESSVLEELLTRHRTTVYRTARRFVESAEDADDPVQETMFTPSWVSANFAVRHASPPGWLQSQSMLLCPAKGSRAISPGSISMRHKKQRIEGERGSYLIDIRIRSRNTFAGSFAPFSAERSQGSTGNTGSFCKHAILMNLPLRRPSELWALLMQRPSRDYIGREDNFRAFYVDIAPHARVSIQGGLDSDAVCGK